jgi:hypothetical protein
MGHRATTEPIATKKSHPGGDDCTQYEHNSFGVIKLFKVQSNGTTLFGSALRHQGFIAVEVHRATLERHLHRDWIQSDEPIVRLEMSEAQWAQFVSSVGCGTGVPVTLNQAPPIGTRIESMDGLKSEPVKKTFDREIATKVAKMIENGTAALATLEAMAEQKTVSKTELKTAISLMQNHIQNLPSNMKFVQTQFAETMEQTIQDGKIEMETFVGNLAMSTGLDVLRAQQAPTLIEDETVNTLTPDGK